jgi:hypothetical protein
MQALLRKNLAAIAPGRHELWRVGIGESPGFGEIFIPQGNSGAASMLKAHRTDSRPDGARASHHGCGREGP